jgi:hypothetical protein
MIFRFWHSAAELMLLRLPCFAFGAGKIGTRTKHAALRRASPVTRIELVPVV